MRFLPPALLTLCVVQLALTVVILYRHRRWPWLVALFALVPWFWGVGFLLAFGLAMG